MTIILKSCLVWYGTDIGCLLHRVTKFEYPAKPEICAPNIVCFSGILSNKLNFTIQKIQVTTGMSPYEHAIRTPVAKKAKLGQPFIFSEPFIFSFLALIHLNKQNWNLEVVFYLTVILLFYSNIINTFIELKHRR